MKERFSGKIGYVLAAAGSAVGLGNIWRFPYLAAKYGGGIFLLTYLILALTFGYALLIAENGLGQMTGSAPIGAYRKICAGQKGFRKFLISGGWINALVPLIVLPYYCVIGGWVSKYIVALACNPVEKFSQHATVSLPGGGEVGAAENYFMQFVSSTWEPWGYFCFFLLVSSVVIACGVKKGVERFNKILMPLLFLLIIAICIYCLFLPGAEDGFRFYLMPDWSKFSFMTVIAAMGQLFYSLSIAMGIMFTYGAYMRSEDDLVSGVNQVEFFDTAVSFLCGMMIIPAVVSFGGREAAENAGVGLIFITMPQVFATFPVGRIVGVVFFILVLFAAATSTISLLETNIHTCRQELRMSRHRALFINIAEVLTVGTITILGYSIWKHSHPLKFFRMCEKLNILETLDFISNNLLMPVAAIFTTLLVVAVVGVKNFSGRIQHGKIWHRECIFHFCMRWLVIPCLLLILLQSCGFFG